MDVDELQDWLDFILICEPNDDTGERHVECTYCSQDDYLFGDWTGDLQGVAEILMEHVTKWHPAKLPQPQVQPVTDEEVAEVRKSLAAVQSEHSAPATPTRNLHTHPEEG